MGELLRKLVGWGEVVGPEDGSELGLALVVNIGIGVIVGETDILG